MRFSGVFVSYVLVTVLNLYCKLYHRIARYAHEVLYKIACNFKQKPPYSERLRLSQSFFRQYGKRFSHQFSYSFFKILAWKKLLLVPLLVFWKVFFTEFVTFNDPRLAYSIPIVSLHNHKFPLHKGLLFVGVINGSRKA